jgi:putative SOS response-associated peptidase YedK
MCGRFYLDVMMDELEAYFNLQSVLDSIPPRYNIAPSQEILAVISQAQKKQLKTFHWGLIPFWAKDQKIGYKCINARAETVDIKPAFRAAFKTRRCLIPCSGFFEWKSENNTKQPYCFRPTKQPMFALAGLYEHWRDQSGHKIDSCTIIVGEANRCVAPVHDRMPVILTPDHFELWLDPEIQDKERLKSLLQPLQEVEIRGHPVSTEINNPKNNRADLIKDISNME